MFHEATLLRIFTGESDRHNHLPLYESVVLRAKEIGLAGATVLRGPMGFGISSTVHSAKILQLSTDLPVVIEIVDSEEKLLPFVEELRGMMGDGLATMEKVRVLNLRPAPAGSEVLEVGAHLPRGKP